MQKLAACFFPPLTTWVVLAFVFSPQAASGDEYYSLAVQTSTPARFDQGAVVQIDAHGTDTLSVKNMPAADTATEAVTIRIQRASAHLEPGGNFIFAYQGTPSDLYPAATLILQRLSDGLFFKVIVEFTVSSNDIVITRLYGARCGPTENHCP